MPLHVPAVQRQEVSGGGKGSLAGGVRLYASEVRNRPTPNQPSR